MNTARSVCAQRNCLIADDDAVYDPALQMLPQPAHRLDIAGDRRSRATGLRRFRRHPQLVFLGSPPTLVITSTAIIVSYALGQSECSLSRATIDVQRNGLRFLSVLASSAMMATSFLA